MGQQRLSPYIANLIHYWTRSEVGLDSTWGGGRLPSFQLGASGSFLTEPCFWVLPHDSMV